MPLPSWFIYRDLGIRRLEGTFAEAYTFDDPSVTRS